MNEQNNNNNNRKETHLADEPLDGSPLRVFQGLHQDVSDEEKQRIKLFEEDYSFRVLIEAESYYQLDAYKMTVKMLEAYTKIYFNNGIAWNRLGTSYSALNDELKALTCFQRAYELIPEDMDIVLNYAGTLCEFSKVDKAKQVLIKHFAIHPENKLHFYFHWKVAGYSMLVIKEAWRKRKDKPIKVVNA